MRCAAPKSIHGAGWFLAGRITRPIAPGFTITPTEAEKLANAIAAPSILAPVQPAPR